MKNFKNFIMISAFLTLLFSSACKKSGESSTLNPDPEIPTAEIPSQPNQTTIIEKKKEEIRLTQTPGLPDGPHPRIWLTKDEIYRLVTKRDSNDPEWIKLFNWCELHLEDKGYNIDPPNQAKDDLTNWSGNNAYNEYRMSGFALHLMNYALAYQVLKADGFRKDQTKASLYAARVRTLLIEGIAESLKAGEESNGLKALRVGLHDITVNADEVTALGISKTTYKNGYSARFLSAVPIAYDWVYETLSEKEKNILLPMMLRWYDWIRGVRSEFNNGVLVKGIRYHEDQKGNCSGNDHCTSYSGIETIGFDYQNMAGNFNGGFTYLMSLIPVALYGDHPSIPDYFTHYQSYLEKTVLNQLESDVKHSGGDSVEGWNYGSGYHYTLLGLYGYYTATGDSKIINSPWPSSLVNAMIHRTGGNLLEVPMYGYWTGTPLGKNRLGMALPYIAIEQRLHPGSLMGHVGQFFLHQVKYEDSVEDWKMVLWHDKKISETPPTELSLAYLAKGNGLFTSKSSWADPKSVLMSVRLEGKLSAAHESYDEGDLSLMRGTDKLLTHQNSLGDGAPSVSSNTIVFNGLNHQPLNAPQIKPAVDRMESGAGYSYVSGDITNAWKRPYKVDQAKLFRRSVLHVFPGWIIVNDVTQSNPAFGNKKEWYTQYLSQPSINGHTISATVGSSKVFVKTLYPTGGTFTTSNMGEGYYRVSYLPNATQEYDQFLHLIQATDNTAIEQIASEILSFGSVRGVHIKDGAKNIIALFSADKLGARIEGEIAYSFSPTSQSSTLYIADLKAGQRYDLVVTGAGEKQVRLSPSLSGKYQASENGLLIMEIR